MHRFNPAFLVSAVLLCSGACAFAAPDERVSTLSVRGSGEVSVPPDLALVRVGVLAQDAQAKVAQQQVNGAVDKIFAKLRELEIRDRDLRTVELQISPVYSQVRNEESRITGYRASNVVQVTVRELDKLGSVIDGALGAGGNRIDGVWFSLEQDREARTQALERAVEDARTKASAIAKSLGLRLGRVISAQEAGVNTGPVENFRVFAAETSSATPTAPGEIRVNGQVSLEYELE